MKDEGEDIDYDLFHRCRNFIFTGFALMLSTKFGLAVVQFYSLVLIFVVAKQNQQKIRETICKQICYLFVFIAQNILYAI